ncbi:TolC family protein [Edaphobacter sp. HDX4]|uniref:TolC family protein n=1 Tax=Edaphobacter sp. HDX4 TaxID=2794064 RepID=UPI002FE62750
MIRSHFSVPHRRALRNSVFPQQSAAELRDKRKIARVAQVERLALIAVALLVCSVDSIAQTSAAPPLLTEAYAVNIARSANRPTKSSEIAIDRAIQSVKQAKTGFYPQSDLQILSGYPLADFNLTIPKGTLGTYPGTGPIPSENANISGNAQITGFIRGSFAQPISQLYRIHLSVESARVDQKIASEQLRSQHQSVTLQVRQTYHQICTQRVQIDSDQAQVQALEEAFRVTKNSAAQGHALQSDELKAESSLVQARYSLDSDRNAMTNAREQLNNLLGRDLDTDFTVEELPPASPEEISLTDARAAALKQRPELREAMLQEKKAELAVKQEKAGYIPDISAQITYLSAQNVSFLPQSFATAGVSLQWKNPWDWGNRHTNIVGLRDAAKQQSLSTDETTQQVTMNVDQTFRALALARQLVEAASLARQASAEQLRETQNQFRQHTALLSDVLKQAAEDHVQSQNYAQALTAYWNARAAFDQALGRD